MPLNSCYRVLNFLRNMAFLRSENPALGFEFPKEYGLLRSENPALGKSNNSVKTEIYFNNSKKQHGCK